MAASFLSLCSLAQAQAWRFFAGRTSVLAAIGALALQGCTTLDSLLGDKACDAGRCAAGYSCWEARNTCVTTAELPSLVAAEQLSTESSAKVNDRATGSAHDDGTGSSEPESLALEPDTGEPEPGAVALEPDMGESEPGAVALEPDMGEPDEVEPEPEPTVIVSAEPEPEPDEVEPEAPDVTEQDAGSVAEPEVLAACSRSLIFDTPEPISVEGLSGDTYRPVLSADHHTLYFSVIVDGRAQIWMAERTGRGPVFSNATPLSGVNMNDTGTPFVSADGSRLYFFSDRPGGSGGWDLYLATSAFGGGFESPMAMTRLNTSGSDNAPWLPEDETWIVYVSPPLNSTDPWAADLWTASRRSADDYFDSPTPLGGLNTEYAESSPFLTDQARMIYFTSDRLGGSGGSDIWQATRASSNQDFANPISLASVNGPTDDLDASVSSDGAELLFVSDREGSMALYRALALCD